MITLCRVHLETLVLLIFVVQLSRPVCVDVPSETEAVLGKSMKLTCISCMKREEVKAKTRVDWYYMAAAKENKTHIYQYENASPVDVDGPFKGRLAWNGSQDLQDVSIMILNVTYNDSGLYECYVLREFEFGFFTPSFTVMKNISLIVKEKATKETAAIYSEIMMYLLLVFLTLWLLLEMVYCYRKISKSDEQAQDTALYFTDLLWPDDPLIHG
ncbi:sodium channel regulatory subunit beta-3 isoform X2 [Leuresthes tenuis]|uniref:sodium channel regulatory subunit beta-3 isoform X2 n=1 Tax=Leuresthes tenuis TaxID=355514 RepID=UPI003B5008DA